MTKKLSTHLTEASDGRLLRALSCCFILFSLLVAARVGALDIPPAPNQWVTDRAGVLSSPDLQQLNEKLRQFEQRSGAQFIIYVLPALEDEALEDFTMRAAESWKVGNKKYDNGLILFVFTQNRKIRVEVGYGLEGAVPDAYSSRIIRDELAPRFRANDFAGGLNAAADRFISRIEGNEPAVTPVSQPGAGGNVGSLLPLIFIILIFVFFVLPLLRRGGGCGGCGCLPIFPFPMGGTTFGGGGGGWSGGGGGFGGFSGGGGSFGGGGASGGW